MFYSQKAPNVSSAEIDKQGDPLSEIDTQGDSFSAILPLIPNVAYGQSDKSGDPPSASFPLTAALSTSCSPSNPPPPPGTNFADLIYGSDQRDIINGGNGNDELHGCDGNDDLFGDNGEDKLFGDAGNDFLSGDNAKDELTGGPGADTFDCGNAKDVTIRDFNADEGDKFVNKSPPPATIPTVEGSTCEKAEINSPPTLQLPSAITAEATGPGGAVVTFTATATDAQDGSITPVCNPPSGSTFPITVTTVSCTATDSNNAQTTGTFTVTITDTTAPTVTVPANIQAEADTLGGKIIFYAASANDIADGPLTPLCGPLSSGDTFPITVTTITCTATDAHGNTGSASFTVTITDTIAPETTITSAKVPSTEPNNDIGDGDTTTIDSIIFTFQASDIGSGVNHIICELAGPTSFPPEECTSPKSYTGLADGTYTFSAKAVDNVGNDPADSFTWTISTPPPPPPPPNPGGRLAGRGGGSPRRFHCMRLMPISLVPEMLRITLPV